MFEELTAGQYLDWVQFDRQFKIAFDRDDLLWGIMTADFRNAHRGENATETIPAECMPYFDAYADDDAFLASIRAFASQHHKG